MGKICAQDLQQQEFKNQKKGNFSTNYENNTRFLEKATLLLNSPEVLLLSTKQVNTKQMILFASSK